MSHIRLYIVLLVLQLCVPLLAQHVAWLEGEEQCYDYLDYSKAKTSGYVYPSLEYLQVGDDIAKDTATYERTFYVDSSRPILLIHSTIFLSGHASADEVIRWSIPELGIFNEYKSYSDQKKQSFIHWIDLDQCAVDSFTLFIFTSDCSFKVHPCNMSFALGCMPKQLDLFYCETDEQMCVEVKAHARSYFWYEESAPSVCLSNEKRLCIVPQPTAIYHCRTIIEEDLPPVDYTIRGDIQPCQSFYSEESASYTTKYKWRNRTLTAPGVYYDSLQNRCHCDSIYALILYNENIIHDTICANQTYTWRTKVLRNAGHYTDSIFRDGHLDTIYHLYLSVIPTPLTLIKDTLCAGTTLNWGGHRIQTSGMYYDTLLSVNNCDSIIALQVFVLPPQDSILEKQICEGETFHWRNHTYSTNVIISDTVHIPNECDSIYHLHLTISPKTFANLSYSLCLGDSLRIFDKTYHHPGTFYDTLVNVAGCDSIITISIHQLSDCNISSEHPLNPLGDCARPTYSNTDTTFIYDSLQMHPFVWFGNEYNEPGIYEDTLISGNVQGCDSIGSLLLRVIYQDTLTACGDEQVTFHTPWGDYLSRPDCDCLNGYPIQTSDGEWLVDVTLCVTRSVCDCDTAYSITYQEITETDLPTFQWNGIPMTTMPENAQRDTTLVFPTMKMDASCDSIATLHLHILEACEIPSSLYPVYWRDPKSSH